MEIGSDVGPQELLKAKNSPPCNHQDLGFQVLKDFVLQHLDEMLWGAHVVARLAACSGQTPWDHPKLLIHVIVAMAHRQLADENHSARAPLDEPCKVGKHKLVPLPTINLHKPVGPQLALIPQFLLVDDAQCVVQPCQVDVCIG